MIKHEIPTATAANPMRSAARKSGFNEKAEVDRIIKKMLKNDVIEESTSPWDS